jgi:photosystem II stability/assembly factor-like uncharacterized protein
MPQPLYISTRKGLFRLEKIGNAWAITASSFLGDNVTLAYTDPRDGFVYAALSHGHFGCKLHRSRDGAKSWEELSAPQYPEPPADVVPIVDPNRGITIPWKLELIWSLEAGGKNEPGRLWCGTAPGGLFRSDDSGATWTLIRSLWDKPERREWFGGGLDYPGIHSICVDPRDPKRIAVGISCGGVWITTDGGESWSIKSKGMRAAYMPPERAFDENIQDPHRVVQCARQPQWYWAQHHNGIFVSSDGCESWREIAEAGPSNFGFAAAVHPGRGDTAWFVPALSDERRLPIDGRVVVTRTRDGGKTFDTLTNGLPQTHAYDIAFRHCLDIDSTGKVLAFGSTTGSVWITENEGDSWTCVTTSLPPVYSVRFA